MATTIYVWLISENNPGHVSMQVNHAYISYWPESAAGKKDFKVGQTHEPVFPSSYKVDCRLEKNDCENQVLLNTLDERAMLKFWEEFKKDPAKYNMASSIVGDRI